MADLGTLEIALRNADAAGDVDAARTFATEILKLQMAAPQPQPQDAGPSTMEGFPGMPVAASMGLGNELRGAGQNLDRFARMTANGMTFGLADKFAGGMDALTGQAGSYDEGVKAQRAQTEQIRQQQPGLATAGELAGGLAGGIGLMRSGATLAGRVGPNLLPRAIGYGAEGAAYGAAHGAGNTYSDNLKDYVDNAKKHGTLGGMIGAGLPVAGTLASGAYRLGSAFLGPRVEGVGRGASSMMRTAAMADEQGLRNLSSMGPEAMLVDAGPAMKGLGQGAATGTGDGRSQLVNALMNRDRGTGQRLQQTLDTELGPAPNPNRIEAGLNADRAFVGQDYGPALQNARAVDTTQLANAMEAAAVNLRGPAQRVAREIRNMLDVTGNPGVLDPHPGVLHNTRQAIDGMLATETNPQAVRVLTMARQAVDGELARAVPGVKNIDAAFEELSRQSEGLQRGSRIFDTGKTAIRPQELAEDLTQAAQPKGVGTGPSAEPMRVRQGARAEIDRMVGTNVNDLTALERKIATPQDWNYQKMETIFGSGPTGRLAQALMNNRTFRQSYQDIVQNSQTAQRAKAASAMEGASGGNIPQDTTLTGLGLRGVQLVAKALSGASSATTKDEIGRVLASQGPQVQRIAQELLDSAVRASRNSQTLSRLVGAPQWIGGATALSGSGGRK
jgi:hypothetical protein